MSIKFSIRSAAGKAKMEGDFIVRFSGDSEPLTHVSERQSKKVGVDGGGQPKIKYVTGLDDTNIQFYNWFSDAEKKEIRKQLSEMKKIITDFYGGEDVVNEYNSYFWKENRDVNRLSINTAVLDTFYDTANPVHALLYLSILSGAYMETVAPSKEWAERNLIHHYLALETDENPDYDEEIVRSDAHGVLSELRREESPDALFILAWCIQYDTNAFGGINRATPQKTLASTHIQYIDGKLVTKKKKNTPKVFTEYADLWKSSQTRPRLYAEAYLKAGEYFNFVNQKDKKYTTDGGTALGNTIEEAVDNLLKPKYREDLDKLKEKVEEKWKE